MFYELFCLESLILSFPKVVQIPPESPCILVTPMSNTTALNFTAQTDPTDETPHSAVYRVAVRLPLLRPDRPAV